MVTAVPERVVPTQPVGVDRSRRTDSRSFDDPGTIYYFSGKRTFKYETIRFLYPDSRGIDRSRECGTFDLEKLDTGPVTYLLEGQYMDEIDRIMEMHPGGELIVDDRTQPLYIVYHLAGKTKYICLHESFQPVGLLRPTVGN